MRPIIECARCAKDKPHYARGICGACYQWLVDNHRDGLADYPLTRNAPTLDVDDVQVDRAVDWLIAYAAVPANRPALKGTRPRLTRGERIEVLRRTRHNVPTWIAIAALGISGGYAPRYLEAAGMAS